jgi:hypothetical protein
MSKAAVPKDRRVQRFIASIAGAITLLLGFAGESNAQSLIEKVTNAARGFASVTTDAAMIGANSTDLESRGLPTVAIGAVTLGVSQVEYKAAVGVRVHVYYMNPTDQAVTIPAPTDQTFVLVENKGHRLQFLSMRVEDVPKGVKSLTIPALERVSATVLYNLPEGSGADAVLKVGAAGMIRGIPLRDADVAAPVPNPAEAAPPPAAAPKHDSTAFTASIKTKETY